MNSLALEHCDVLIIGAGPAGMAAAVAAAPSGAVIVIIDDNAAPGGQIWRDGPGVQLPSLALDLRHALTKWANIRIYSGTRVIAAPFPGQLLLEDAQRGWCMQWKKLILCTGARERLLPFPGWTLPGVTGAGALQALIKSGLPVKGERIVVAGSGPLLLAAAATAAKAGAKVVHIAEQASLAAVAGFALGLVRWPEKLAQTLMMTSPHFRTYRTYRTSSHVVSAQGADKVIAARLKQGSNHFDIECDRIACGFGLVPNTELGQTLGCMVYAAAGGAGALTVDTWQLTSMPNIYAAGECTGFGGSEQALVQGRIAGYAVVDDLAAAEKLWPERLHWRAFAARLERSFTLNPALKDLPGPTTLVCRCEDVPHSALMTRTGWIDAKLHTRCGMGACQGRVCGVATQFLFDWSTPTPRTPLSPARISTLAGLNSMRPGGACKPPLKT